MKKEFVDHANKPGHIETTAEIVGVHREEDQYKKVRTANDQFFVTYYQKPLWCINPKLFFDNLTNTYYPLIIARTTN